MHFTMLMSKKNRVQIYEYLFKEGVMVAKKDFNAPKHNAEELASIPNLQVIKAMQSLKSSEPVFKQTDAFTRSMVIGLKRAGWSLRQIAANTHLGASTVHRLWRRWLEQGNVAIYRNVGATRVTSARVDRHILRQAVAAPQATCTAILQHVQDTLDHSISTRTISRRLVANGLHSCRPLRRLPLTPPNRRQRLEWCQARSTWMTEWHRVVFSDESRFCLSSDSRRVHVWRRRGERSNPAAIVERPTVRQRGIMVWGAIAYDSRSPLLRIQGTMTAQRYVDDLLRPVTLPYLQGVPNALYQQDNDRPHTARISQQALQDVQMLPWPPYSPDLSPIEHVWDIIGRRLHALPQPRSEDELWQMVEMEWRAIPQDAICTLIDSLPRRVAACIAVSENPRTTLLELEQDTGISKTTIGKIVTEDLKLKRTPAKCIPRFLTNEQNLCRLATCEDMFKMTRMDSEWKDKIITGDETWVYGYDPETKRQSAEWRGQGEPRPKKSRILKSRNKVLLVAFLDNKGIILHHDNARPHTAHLVTSFLAKIGTQILPQPPYSPDIAPNDFFLFPKLKAVLKGRHFDTREDIIEKSLLALKSIPKEAYKNCFDNWEKRWRWGVAESMVVEGVLLWRGNRSWADLLLEEVYCRFISVVGDHFFQIMVQKLLEEGGFTMLMSKKNRVQIYEYLFKEGVMVAKKDFNAPKHNAEELASIPNLQVIKAMQSLKSKGYVKEQFAWRHYYWYLTNEGIQYLRDFLHLPPEIVPSTLKRQSNKNEAARARTRAMDTAAPKSGTTERDSYRRSGPPSDKRGEMGPGNGKSDYKGGFGRGRPQ
ncbi:RPS10 [Cordylochernes scorpioides]|uniref:RPS10 n=1 Tax=Cordylochernes scorpioides TaxID=51811 RepID=A0ABY6JYL4_9ARAC|nr:RPS10 [Cordylochernes scorpioides]